MLPAPPKIIRIGNAHKYSSFALNWPGTSKVISASECSVMVSVELGMAFKVESFKGSSVPILKNCVIICAEFVVSTSDEFIIVKVDVTVNKGQLRWMLL